MEMGRGSKELDPTGRNQETFTTNIYMTSTWSLPLSGIWPSLKPASLGSCVQNCPDQALSSYTRVMV